MTQRQQELLATIIREFIDTATAVGSVSLYDKYDLNVSPATIRNEMAALVREGYLEKPHSSSGRVPTNLGIRYFIQEILNEDEYENPDVVTKERLNQEFHLARFEQEQLIRQALTWLVGISGNASIGLIGKDIYYSGLSSMLEVPEFQELDKLRQLMVVLEDYAALSSIFDRASSENVHVLVGSEMGLDSFEDYAVVFAEVTVHSGQEGYISVIGPNRMAYNKIIPAVEFVANSISNVVKGW